MARLAKLCWGIEYKRLTERHFSAREFPSGVLWRLEGVPIPNPNHFAVAGTTGGPVSALNINLLKRSNFLRGAFPAEYGDVTSGVFDVYFRSGNFDTTEITAQIHATGGLELNGGTPKKGE